MIFHDGSLRSRQPSGPWRRFVGKCLTLRRDTPTSTTSARVLTEWWCPPSMPSSRKKSPSKKSLPSNTRPIVSEPSVKSRLGDFCFRCVFASFVFVVFLLFLFFDCDLKFVALLFLMPEFFLHADTHPIWTREHHRHTRYHSRQHHGRNEGKSCRCNSTTCVLH